MVYVQFGKFKFVEDTLENFVRWKKFSNGVPLKFLPKMLPGETLCNFFQIFPPKDLVYKGRKILSRLFINLTIFT